MYFLVLSIYARMSMSPVQGASLIVMESYSVLSLFCHNLSSYHFTVSHFQSCNTHRQVDATETLPLFHPIFYENTSTRLAPFYRSTYGRGT